ncbi:MAG TPA: hypothetical protein PLN91_12540 [Rhodanobacteraceae bacterium]|nr:hypothetical protein [Rhodanobacteraceae bacterium]
MTPPDSELYHRGERFFRAIEAKYAEYKSREATFRARLDNAQADRELWKAHGIGVAILMLRMHMVAPVDVDIPLPDTRAGDLPEV